MLNFIWLDIDSRLQINDSKWLDNSVTRLWLNQVMTHLWLDSNIFRLLWLDSKGLWLWLDSDYTKWLGHNTTQLVTNYVGVRKAREIQEILPCALFQSTSNSCPMFPASLKFNLVLHKTSIIILSNNYFVSQRPSFMVIVLKSKQIQMSNFLWFAWMLIAFPSLGTSRSRAECICVEKQQRTNLTVTLLLVYCIVS